MKKQVITGSKMPKALTPSMSNKKAAPRSERPGQAPKVEAKMVQVTPSNFSSRKSSPKKTENDVLPPGKRPNTLRSNKINSKKLDNIRI